MLLVRCRQGSRVGFESGFCAVCWRVSHIVKVILRIYEVRLASIENARLGKM
jgi:hypothetical protein